MKLGCDMNFIFPKQPQRSGPISRDRSRFLALFWKEKPVSYNPGNMVYQSKDMQWLILPSLKHCATTISKSLANFL